VTDSETNKARLRRALAAYSEGDIGPLREMVDPDVVYHSHSPHTLFRFGGRHEGFANAIAAMAAMASDYSIHSYRVGDLTAEGDVVWSVAEIDATYRRSKARFKIALAVRWQFRSGRIVGVEEYFDTAEGALKQGLVTPVASRK
jgi:ketosteroid isomerase-like protein